MKRVPTDAIETLTSRFDAALRVDRGVGYIAAVERLAPMIAQLRDQGVSLEEISGLLAEGGVTISVSTLRSYLSRIARSARSASKRAPRGKSTAAPPPTELVQRGAGHASRVAGPPVGAPPPGDLSSGRSEDGNQSGPSEERAKGRFEVKPDSVRL